MSAILPKRPVLKLRFPRDRAGPVPAESLPARDDPDWPELLDRIGRLETRKSRRTKGLS